MRRLTTPIVNKWNSHAMLTGMKEGTTLENNLVVSQNVKCTLPYDLAIPHQGIYGREMEAYIYTKTCT